MIKLALLTVTYCGLWYRGEALSLKQQIERARELGFEGIAVETKRPVALPCDLDGRTRTEIREVAKSLDVKICAIETVSNFASPIIEERENNLCTVKEAIKLAADLETNTVKVFAAWSGTSRFDGLGTYELGRRISDFRSGFVPMEHMWRWAVQGIREVARWAEEYGITIALQNHPPVLRLRYEDVLEMVKEINMSNVKLCLDVPLFTNQSDEYIHEAVEACKDVGIVHSHYGSFVFDELSSGEITVKHSPLIGNLYVNYPAFLKELARISYDGFIASEECSPVLESHEAKGIDTVDRHVKASLRYMKELISTGRDPRLIKH